MPVCITPSVNPLLCLYHLSRVADDVSPVPEAAKGINDQRANYVSPEPEAAKGINDQRANDFPHRPEAASCIKDCKER